MFEKNNLYNKMFIGGRCACPRMNETAYGRGKLKEFLRLLTLMNCFREKDD